MSDWMPMQYDLPTHHATLSIAAGLGIDPDTVVGTLLRVWAWAQQRTTTGRIKATTKMLDQIARRPGFSRELLSARWLRVDGAWLIFPRWNKWLSKGAKKRALDQARKRRDREQEKRTPRGHEADTKRTKMGTTMRATKTAESNTAFAAALKQDAPELCSLLLEIVHNGVRVFEPAAAAAIAGSTTRMQVVWAVERMNERFKGGKRVANPAGYLRNLIENQEPPRAWQERWRREQVAKVAAMANGTKAGVA